MAASSEALNSSLGGRAVMLGLGLPLFTALVRCLKAVLPRRGRRGRSCSSLAWQALLAVAAHVPCCSTNTNHVLSRSMKMDPWASASDGESPQHRAERVWVPPPPPLQGLARHVEHDPADVQILRAPLPPVHHCQHLWPTRFNTAGPRLPAAWGPPGGPKAGHLVDTPPRKTCPEIGCFLRIVSASLRQPGDLRGFTVLLAPGPHLV